MKEFIEIPFGAKDSELCGWEYIIPEGFVASIENGKIVVKKEDMTPQEKLAKLRQLADAMYYSMQNLTTDTTKIREAMNNYRQFVIYELKESKL